MTSTNPSDRVRPLHALLTTELGVPSPLGEAVAMLDNASKLSFARQQGAGSARIARATLAREIAEGTRDYGEDSIREYAEGDVWAGDAMDESMVQPASARLANAVTKAAQSAAGGLMMAHASAIFDQLAAEAAQVVDVLASLPAPPRQLFTTGTDQAQLLSRTDGHAETFSTLLRMDDRFWVCQRGADATRDLADAGFERLPDGAPRLAYVYKNWRKAMEQEAALRTTSKHLRLWRCTLDGWQPGVWRPADIETTDAERTFASKLSRLGSAVGIG